MVMVVWHTANRTDLDDETLALGTQLPIRKLTSLYLVRYFPFDESFSGLASYGGSSNHSQETER